MSPHSFRQSVILFFVFFSMLTMLCTFTHPSDCLYFFYIFVICIVYFFLSVHLQQVCYIFVTTTFPLIIYTTIVLTGSMLMHIAFIILLIILSLSGYVLITYDVDI
jgi:hypothetical protein